TAYARARSRTEAAATGGHSPAASKSTSTKPSLGSNRLGRGEVAAILVEAALIRRRPQRGEQLRLHGRPRDEQRVVQVHPEADRPAADERHPHAAPVLVGRVLDDRPALKPRLLLVLRVQHQAVTRLPDRSLHDITDLHLPLAVAGEMQRNR